MKNSIVLIVFFLGTFFGVQAQEFLYGDPLPDAPQLSVRGAHTIGVRTLNLVNKDQIDILNSKEGKDPMYDRPLTVEVWYPANVPDGTEASVTYEEVMGTRGDSLRPLIPFTFKGRALRDASSDASTGMFPLVVVSHGYVGSRYIMSYLGENLASKGYVVVAIDHTDSTFKDANVFQSTLLNRAKDIKFVLNEMARLSSPKSGDDLAGVIDTENTGIVGYSMGGYGAVINAGAGVVGDGDRDGLGAVLAVVPAGGHRGCGVVDALGRRAVGGGDRRCRRTVAATRPGQCDRGGAAVFVDREGGRGEVDGAVLGYRDVVGRDGDGARGVGAGDRSGEGGEVDAERLVGLLVGVVGDVDGDRLRADLSVGPGESCRDRRVVVVRVSGPRCGGDQC